MSSTSIASAARTGVARDQVKVDIRDYTDLFAQDRSVDDRKAAYEGLVNRYYNLVTDFYEYGWGQSFHFAPRLKDETFEESIKRYEYTLALRIGAGPGDHLLDVGCGVGGPMRNIARFTGARVTGFNNNQYQVVKGTEHNIAAGLDRQCDFVKGDFMKLPFADNTFDGVYQIEATCHAPDRVPVFSEIFRVLKPGAVFAGYEWVVTDRYDPNNAEHRRIIHDVEEGDALPELVRAHVIDEALEAAGFEEIDCVDVAPTADPETPWYLALSGKERHPRALPRTRLGRAITHRAVRTMERLRIAPEGSTEVSALLNKAADALVEAGELGIFTPMYRHVARKPE